MKSVEATHLAESEIIKDKLSFGIDGLEWLVLQTNADERRRESLTSYIDLTKKVWQKDIEAVFKDAITMNEDDFYNTHGLNWWISFDEALTYLSIMRMQNYNRYFEYLNSIYKEEENR